MEIVDHISDVVPTECVRKVLSKPPVGRQQIFNDYMCEMTNFSINFCPFVQCKYYMIRT